ncbi:MAG: hypothetical protein ACKO0Z_08725 [Betaproteobacteria bacterium]
MDAFEQLVADLFWNEGYWVRTGFKIDLTREDKLRIHRPSSPRWEIDLVAWNAQKNELLAVECKSYLDSGGVHAAHFLPGAKYAHRYKLFHDPDLRNTVLDRLKSQCVERGLCPANAAVRLALAYGYATHENTKRLRQIFESSGWLLFEPEWIRERLNQIAGTSYENNMASVVAKLLLRSNSGPKKIAISSLLEAEEVL